MFISIINKLNINKLNIILINLILYLNINLKNILKNVTPRPPPPQKVLQNHFQVICPWMPLYAPVRPCVKT